ncbi:flavodoxin [Pontibacillus halophilus JSM 076056 = DSM 19796]|uniref:Flavodoxin n=1 Tax=Pontibacillus halophilus JSM 076056 = DSM 19796 TaxID=1385510 RepID=A0A0A5GJY1_9BACI|nr:flavodoxin [Pontibacillus halophilus]KGX92324.1 flavodoxin [Pontibacillus halophilus JSM 076056 = DSM 19796]
MANVLIAFVSMSGNTEEIADMLRDELKQLGHTVTMEEMDDLMPAEMLRYDAVLLGSYTWGDGDLPYEIEDFYDDLEVMEFDGLKTAVFGSGDREYPIFCGAVDTLQKRLKETGANVVTEGLRLEFAPEKEDVETCKAFVTSFSNAL